MSEEGLRTQLGGAAAEGRRGTSFLSLPHLSVHTGAGKLPLHGGELHPRGVCGGRGSLRECAGGRRRSPSSRIAVRQPHLSLGAEDMFFLEAPPP